MLWYLVNKLWPHAVLNGGGGRHSGAKSTTTGASTSKIINLEYTWTIDNFSVDRREALRSPNFGPTARDPMQFNLKLYPRGLEATDTDYIALFLKLASTDKDQVNVFYKLSIIDQNGRKRNTFGNGQMHSFVRGGLGWGWSKFIHRDKLNPTKGLLNGSTLTINCEVLVIPTASVASEDSKNSLNEPNHNFARWFLNEMFSDVELLADDKELPAHKFVLAIRSPVFASLFEDGDTDVSRVKMNESADVVNQFLEYIYTGKASFLEMYASRLLGLANEYQMEHLKTQCEKSLCGKMSIVSVIDMLDLAKKHSASTLKAKALEFIREQVLDVVEYQSDLLIRAFRSLVDEAPVNCNGDNAHQASSGEVKKRTTSKVHSFSHVWRIENFRHLCDESIASRRPTIHSCTFGPSHNDPPKFQLEIQPRSKILLLDKWISLYFNVVAHKDDQLCVRYSFSILDAEEKRHNTKGSNWVKSGKRQRGGCTWFIKRSHLLSRAKELLPGDALTIMCEGKVVSSRKKNKPHKKDHSKEESAEGDNSGENYSSWLGNEKLSDVSLITAGGDELRAHKMVLSVGSPVFAAMFQHEMKENLENRVELTDVEPDVAEKFLAYLYTGKIEQHSIEPFAEPLLVLADKFQVDHLKSLCEQFLCTEVNNATALELLQLAEQHNATELKAKAQEFIREATLDAIESLTDQKALIAAYRDLVLDEESLEE